MAVVGIDCGIRSFTVTAVRGPSYEEDLLLTKTYDTPRSTRRSHELQAISAYVDGLYKELGVGPDALFVVESPIVAGARNLRTSLLLAQVTGIVQSRLSNVIEVAVAQWKKEVVGKGNAKKEEVALWVEENHPEAFLHLKGSQDALDAFCIALYGEAVQDRLHATLGAWRGDP